MNALLSMIPKAPKVPHDFAALMTYQAPQRSRHVRRLAENAARLGGIELEGATQADDLG